MLKIKAFMYEMKEEVLVSLIIIFVGFASFGLGRLSISAQDTAEIEILSTGASTKSTEESAKIDQTASASVVEGGEQVVASKNGTKYHFPWCGGAKQIAEKNKITFNTIEEARIAGYMPAGNCKGLK